MTVRPIMFSAAMVNAIRDGRKTQTRRPIKLPKALAGGSLSNAWPDKIFGVTPGLHIPMPDQTVERLRNPWGWPEPSQLWVKEAYRTSKSLDHLKPSQIAPRPGLQYEAGGTSVGATRLEGSGRYRAARFMPCWASRITLDITDVRVERLQDISYEDALAEGMPNSAQWIAHDPTHISGETPEQTARRLRWPQRWYENLWNELYGDGASKINPWVWVIAFRPANPRAPRNDAPWPQL